MASAGLPPRQSTSDELHDTTQASFDHAQAAIEAAIHAYQIGLQQETYEQLGEKQKAQLHDFGAQVRGAVSGTHKCMQEVIGFTHLSMEVRDKAANCLVLKDSMLQDLRGREAAKSFLRHLNYVRNKDFYDCAKVMEESIQQWQQVQAAQENLVRSLDSEAKACDALRLSLDKSAERVRMFKLAATCTLCVLGIPVAVLLGLPALAGCLTSIIAVNTAGALASFGLQKFSNYLAEVQQRLEEQKAEAERRKDAALSAKEAMQGFGQRVGDVLHTEADLRSALNDAGGWTASELEQLKTSTAATIEDAKKLWRRFERCQNEEDVIKVCQFANTLAIKDDLIELFDAEADKYGKLRLKFYDMRKSIGELEAAIALLPIPLPETPPPPAPSPREFGVAALASE